MYIVYVLDLSSEVAMYVFVYLNVLSAHASYYIGRTRTKEGKDLAPAAPKVGPGWRGRGPPDRGDQGMVDPAPSRGEPP